MANILSSIPGQFGKALILGALLPATFFVILLLSLVPTSVDGLAFFAPLEVVQPAWQALAVLFLILVIAGLLHNLNTPIIRLYEGYPWKDSVLGRWLTGLQKNRYQALRARSDGMFELRTLERTDPRRQQINDIWSEINRSLHSDFPDRPDLILPTRLGNVVRSFERYPSVQYGIDAIYLWPRLVAVLDPEYAAMIDDARTPMNFMLNSSLLSAILALIVGVTGILYAPEPVWLRVVVPVLSFTLLSACFYTLSIGRASAWGNLIRGAFDLYRKKLLEQLGYHQDPTTRRDERRLWQAITTQIMYGDKRLDVNTWEPRVDYVDAPPEGPVRVTPSGIEIKYLRAAKPRGSDGTMTIAWSIRNTDKEDARNLVVTDFVPDGFEYEWQSATAENRAVSTEGANPYRFSIGGALACRGEIVLTYRIIPRKAECAS